jgi:hypothetical protein
VRAAWERAAALGDVEGLNRALEGLCLYHEWRDRHREAEVMLNWVVETLKAAVFPPARRALLSWQCDPGDPERAIEIYALAMRHRFATNSPWFEDVAGRTLAAAVQGLPEQVVAAARERGSARKVDAVLRELLARIEAGNRRGG